MCDLFAAESQHRIDLARAAVVARPRDDSIEREISRDIEALHGLQPALARETEAELNDFVARFRQLSVAEFRITLRDDLLRPLHGHLRRGELSERRTHVAQLALTFGGEHIDGLDVPGDFPFEAIVAWAREHGRAGEVDAALALGGKEVEHISALQERTTIGGVLRDLNTRASIGRNHSFYPPMLTMGSGDDQPGVKLLSAWYTRNLAICARLLQKIKPGDRVVVFYGQGHVYLLQQCLREQPGVQLVDPLNYLAGT